MPNVKEHPTIGAIPTTWNGVTFRSRTEVRWSIFFDTLGIRWEYEPDAYATDAGNYLPDFLLNDLDIFWEVKGIDGEGEAKADALVAATGRPLVLAVGAPSFPPISCLTDSRVPLSVRMRATDLYGGYVHSLVKTFPVFIVECMGCHTIAFAPLAEKDSLNDAWPVHGAAYRRLNPSCACVGGNIDLTTDRLKAAYDAATAARFWNPS